MSLLLCKRAVLRRCAARICGKLGLRSSTCLKQTRHLPYDHGSMKMIRDWVELCVQSHQVHPKLVCHFDQVWTTHYEAAKRVLFKPIEDKGKMRPEHSRKPSVQRLLQSIRTALSLPSETEHEEIVKSDGPKKATLCAQSTLIPVEYPRHARTTTTLSFSDGSVGCAFVTAPSTVVLAA